MIASQAGGPPGSRARRPPRRRPRTRPRRPGRARRALGTALAAALGPWVPLLSGCPASDGSRELPVRLVEEAGPAAAWLGLGGVFRETVRVRPDTPVVVPARLPADPWLDLAVGTSHAGPVTFRVEVRRAGEGRGTTVVQRTVTTPDRWERAATTLAPWAGEAVTLALSVQAAEGEATGLFGSPVVRPRLVPGDDQPRAVVLVVADGVRADHLGFLGYWRDTAPNLAVAAGEGAVFAQAMAPAPGAPASLASLLTGLHPASHGVSGPGLRLPASARTAAELFRDAGYATLGLVSNPALGAWAGMHQGFEVLHEAESLGPPGPHPTQTARPLMDRLLRWLEEHPDVPTFALLHVTDARPPFDPRPPWDVLWADPQVAGQHAADVERARRHVDDPGRRRLGLPGKSALRAAGVAPRAFASRQIDRYDGAIRGLDAELARLFERLDALGIAERSLVAVTSGHGEAFLEHGHAFHGHSVYGELVHVPLVLWGPGRVEAGVRVDAPVGLPDLLPTLLALCRLPGPGGLGGRGLEAYVLAGGSPPSPRPAFAAKPPDPRPGAPRGGWTARAVWSGSWKLIHNEGAPAEVPAVELYAPGEDAFEQRDVAEELPDVADRLRGELGDWRSTTEAARLEGAGEPAPSDSLSDAGRARLRALGYEPDALSAPRR